MTGLLILAAMVLLLILALGPAHRKARLPWRPGYDLRTDRDLARTLADLDATEQSHPPAVDTPKPGLAEPSEATLAA